jgi:transcriptional regulator with XRE-family HTH domain
MGHIERGEKNVSFTTLVRLSDALGITMSELLSDERTATTKLVRTRKNKQPSDVPEIIRELNQQRNALESASGVLKQLATALRAHASKDRRNT